MTNGTPEYVSELTSLLNLGMHMTQLTPTSCGK